MSKISLHGFNNLTKSLSFSLYKLHYLRDINATQNYHAYVNEYFSANKLNVLLTNICQAIGGNVLNVAKQDYQPQGASVTLMISEEAQPTSLVAHLDKSHLCIHTYPEESPQNGTAIFRADIELSTCGVISPLKVINYIIKEFNADVIDIDFRIRGMTRDKQGKKTFDIDDIDNISDFLSPEITDSFCINEHSFNEQNLFHAKLRKKEIKLSDYFFEADTKNFSDKEQRSISEQLSKEIQELFTNTK